jgi:hypothetical protein
VGSSVEDGVGSSAEDEAGSLGEDGVRSSVEGGGDWLAAVPLSVSVSNDVSEAGWNWNLLPPQFGHPDSISLDPSANTRPQFVHW